MNPFIFVFVVLLLAIFGAATFSFGLWMGLIAVAGIVLVIAFGFAVYLLWCLLKTGGSIGSF